MPRATPLHPSHRGGRWLQVDRRSRGCLAGVPEYPARHLAAPDDDVTAPVETSATCPEAGNPRASATSASRLVRSIAPAPVGNSYPRGRCVDRLRASLEGMYRIASPDHVPAGAWRLVARAFTGPFRPQGRSRIGRPQPSFYSIMLGLSGPWATTPSPFLEPVIDSVFRALYLNVSAGHPGGISQPAPDCGERLSRRRLHDTCASPGQAIDALEVGGEVLLPLATAREPHRFLNRRSCELRHML